MPFQSSLTHNHPSNHHPSDFGLLDCPTTPSGVCRVKRQMHKKCTHTIHKQASSAPIDGPWFDVTKSQQNAVPRTFTVMNHDPRALSAREKAKDKIEKRKTEKNAQAPPSGRAASPTPVAAPVLGAMLLARGRDKARMLDDRCIQAVPCRAKL